MPGKLNIISIGKDSQIDPSLCKNHLRLDFDDLDLDNPIHRMAITQFKELPKGLSVATKEDILKAVEFGKKHKVHIIHCSAGVSRSPAIAYAIYRGQGMNKKDAMDQVMEDNPYALPNKWIVKLTDEIFG